MRPGPRARGRAIRVRAPPVACNSSSRTRSSGEERVLYWTGRVRDMPSQPCLALDHGQGVFRPPSSAPSWSYSCDKPASPALPDAPLPETVPGKPASAVISPPPPFPFAGQSRAHSGRSRCHDALPLSGTALRGAGMPSGVPALVKERPILARVRLTSSRLLTRVLLEPARQIRRHLGIPDRAHVRALARAPGGRATSSWTPSHVWVPCGPWERFGPPTLPSFYMPPVLSPRHC